MTRRVLRLNAKTSHRFATAWPQLAFFAFAGLLLFTRLAGPMRIVYPIAAVAVGWRLMRISLGSYVSFLIWLWFLTPFIRRIADLYAGWQEPSFVLLAPYLVTALTIERILEQSIRKQPLPRLAGGSMFGLAALGAGIGVPIGLMTAPAPAMTEILNWLVPLAFGWYLATRYDQLHEIEKHALPAFTRAGLLAGAYGIYQFTVLPPWDLNWMQIVEMVSIGVPEPFTVRVFSTMHAPGVLAFFLVVSLLAWVAKPHASGTPGAALAGVTLLLSQVRSAWMAFVVAAALVIIRLKPAQQVRTLVLLGVAVMATGAFLLTPEMSEMFDRRFSTLERLEEDDSALSRMAGHGAAFEFMLTHPLGAGIGRGDDDVEALISLRDSVIVAVFVQFGLVGSILYLMAFFLLFIQLWRYYRHASSHEGMTLGAAAIGLMIGSLFGATNNGPTGMILWMIGGLATADRHLARQRLAAVQAQTQRLSRARAAVVPERAAG